MKFTFKQKIFALLAASLFLRFVFFAVETGIEIASQIATHSSLATHENLDWYDTSPPTPVPHPRVVQDANKAVDNFHHRFSSASFLDVYKHATPAYRTMDSLEYVRRMVLLWQKLGEVESSREVSRYERLFEGREQIIIEYETQFARDDGYEQFIWDISGSEAKLYSYNVSSPALGK